MIEDSSPAIASSLAAVFPDQVSASTARARLIEAGVRSEDIAVLAVSSSVDSVANDAATYRATDMQDSGHKQQDAAPEIVGIEGGRNGRATVQDPNQDAALADQQHARLVDASVVLTVPVFSGQRSAINRILQECGGTMRRRATDPGLTDHGGESGSESGQSNTRAA